MKSWALLLIVVALSTDANVQKIKSWYLDAAVRLSMDAEGYFIGPAFSAGVGVNLQQPWSVTTGLTYFSKQIDTPGGFYDKLTPSFYS